MNLLLDTCTFIWMESDPGQLSPRASQLIRDPANAVWLSVVSVWEMVVKVGLGKLHLPRDVESIVNDQVRQNGVLVRTLTLPHVFAGQGLPPLHNDPFDRLLVSQAIAEAFTIVTPDSKIRQYPVPTEW